MTINTTLVAASAALSKLAAYMDTFGPLALCEKHGDDVLDNCITVTEAGGKLSPESQLMLDIVTATKSQPESESSDEADESKPSPRKGKGKGKVTPTPSVNVGTCKDAKGRTMYGFEFAIPGVPASSRIKTFYVRAKAEKRAARLAARGYEVKAA